jgi:hypothetical protein
MATYDESIRNITLDAAADLAVYTGVPGLAGSPQPNKGHQYCFVYVSGAHEVDLCHHDTAYPIGVMQNKPQVTGAAVTVAIRGVTLVEAGDTIDAGEAIVIDAGDTGRGVPIGTASAGTVVVGIAVGSGAVGQLVPVLLGRFGA